MMLTSGDISATGPIDGTGRKHREGSYILIHIFPKDCEPQRFKISHGAAEQLRDEINTILLMERLMETTIHVADAKRFTYKDALEAADMDIESIFYVRDGEIFDDGPVLAAANENWIVSVFVPYDPEHILHAQAWDHYAWIAK